MVKTAELILACFEKVTDYINNAAFAYMAVSGEGFCVSSWNAFLLNMKHMLMFGFANLLAKIFIFVGKLTIVAANMVSLYNLMKYRGTLYAIQSLLGPMCLIGGISYMTASVFLGLFDTTVMALMTCLSIDIDMNGNPKYGPPTFHDSI